MVQHLAMIMIYGYQTLPICVRTHLVIYVQVIRIIIMHLMRGSHGRDFVVMQVLMILRSSNGKCGRYKLINQLTTLINDQQSYSRKYITILINKLNLFISLFYYNKNYILFILIK